MFPRNIPEKFARNFARNFGFFRKRISLENLASSKIKSLPARTMEYMEMAFASSAMLIRIRNLFKDASSASANYIQVWEI